MRKGTVYVLIALLSLSCLALTLVPKASSQTVQPQNVKITSYSWYIDLEGDLDVVGQVQNVGNSTVSQVVLTGSILSSGQDISDSATQAFVNDLLPQQKAPFYMEFSAPSAQSEYSAGGWDAYVQAGLTFDLAVASANTTSSYQYQGLTITTATGSIGTAASGDSGQLAGAYIVDGVVKNTGSQAAENITIVGTFFNSSGTVIATGYTDYLSPTILDPGNVADFMVAAFDLNQTQVPSSLKISSYELLIQCELPMNSTNGSPPVPQADVTGTTSSSSSTSTTPTPGSGSSSTSTHGGNTKGSWMSTDLAVTIVVVAVVVLAAAYGVLTLNKARAQHHMTRAERRRAQKAKDESDKED